MSGPPLTQGFQVSITPASRETLLGFGAGSEGLLWAVARVVVCVC
jgi:hypothetical protein